MAMVKFLDYGGYLYVSGDSLRVLRFVDRLVSSRLMTKCDLGFLFRQDFMVIPFQAVEVYLDNVVPVDSKSGEREAFRVQLTEIRSWAPFDWNGD